MDLQIRNRVAIVTGAANGIGAAIATALAAQGVKLLLCDRDADRLAVREKELASAGASVLAVVADVVDPLSVESMVVQCMQRFGAAHILINNAGFTRDMRITKMRDEDWDDVVDVVLRGAFLCTRAAVPLMSKEKWGRIVNISSRAHLGNPGQANYSAAKAGLIGFTRAMAKEGGRDGITVNAVAPGLIATAAVTGLPHFEKIREAAEKITPIQRLGRVEDVADAVLFLCSERASYITGEVLHVTGGRY